MKKVLFPLFIAACIIISSCHKDAKVIPADYYFNATKNNAGWGAVATAYTIPGDSLRLEAFRQTGEEYIFINIKFNGPGTYALTGTQAKFFTTIGMDVITSSYRLDTTQVNSVVITSYNAKTGIISGTFQVSVLKESSDPNEYVSIVFNNGRFRVRLPN